MSNTYRFQTHKCRLQIKILIQTYLPLTKISSFISWKNIGSLNLIHLLLAFVSFDNVEYSNCFHFTFTVNTPLQYKRVFHSFSKLTEKNIRKRNEENWALPISFPVPCFFIMPTMDCSNSMLCVWNQLIHGCLINASFLLKFKNLLMTVVL